MRYTREYEKLVKRMAEAVELEEVWKDAEKVHGKNATKSLNSKNKEQGEKGEI